MENLSYDFKNINFENLTKALLRKYIHDQYKDDILVVEVARRLINPDTVEIFRVHKPKYKLFIGNYVEKITLDRKNKKLTSIIENTNYNEKCTFTELMNYINYQQQYEIKSSIYRFLGRLKKKEFFNKGCQVVEKIISENNYRKI